MTFDEADAACQQIVELGEKLLEYPAADVAKTLEQKCRHHSSQMRGRFGNVAEQFGWVIAAAKKFQKSRVDVTAANMELHTALARVRIALDIHRRADRSRWGE